MLCYRNMCGLCLPIVLCYYCKPIAQKLFSKSKNKPSKDFGAEDTASVAPVPTPIHAHHAKFLSKPSPQQRQRQNEAAAAAAAAQTPGAGQEPGWENIPTPGNTPGVGPPPPLIAGGVSRSSSYHSIPSPNPNPNLNGRPPSPSLTNTSFSRQPGAFSPNPNDYSQRPVPTKKTSATAAVGILASLDPHANPASPALTPYAQHNVSKSHSEERFYTGSENGHYNQQQSFTPSAGNAPPAAERKEKRGFWGSSRDRDRDRRDHQQPQPYEYSQQPGPRVPASTEVPRQSAESERTLTSMIGYLAATNSEDWSVVLEVCDRASLNESNAKEAVKALRSEFKYGQPHAQLAAAKLWAIMLRNSTDIFISQSRQRKFLDTLEELIKSGRSTPVVTDRLLEIIAAAAYASGRHKKGSEKDGFRGLWLRVKPADKPDEGIPFDSEDAMFSPPSTRTSTYDNGIVIGTPTGIPSVALQQASPLPAENIAPIRHKPAGTRNRIIPPDEDIRRLFQECKMAMGNASLLSEALLTCTPSSLKHNAIIKEFHKKCENSQQLIIAQIDWATAQAAQSRVKRNLEKEQRGGDDSEGREDRQRDKDKDGRRRRKDGKDGDDETTEEKLLNALLGANEELQAALRQYEDLYTILVEKKSRKDVRMDRREFAQHQQQQQEQLAVAAGIGASRSRSPSPARSVSGSPPSNHGSVPSHGGHGSTTGHAHSQSFQGTTPVGGVYTTHQGSRTNISPPVQQQGVAPPQGLYTNQTHSQTYINSHRSPPDLQHDNSSLAPPPKAPYGPRSPGNLNNNAMRSRTPSPNGINNRPDELYNGAQPPYSASADYHHGTGVVAVTHNEAYAGSYDGHTQQPPHSAQAQGYGGHYGGYQHGAERYQDDNASSIYQYPQGEQQEYRGQQDYQGYHQQHGTSLQYGGAAEQEEQEMEYDEDGAPLRPTAKALGKRKAQEPVEEETNRRASVTSEDLYLSQQGILSLGPNSDNDADSLSSTNARQGDNAGGVNGSSGGSGAKPWMSPPVQYVYDAAAERTKERLEEAHRAVAAANSTSNTATARPLVNGVH